jgi:hypothetical protein
MQGRKRQVRTVWLGGVGALAIAVGAVAVAQAVTPSDGDYQGCPKGVPTTGGHCESEGYFTLQGNKIKAGATSSAGILAPSDFSCNAGAIPKAKSIPVKNGAFDYDGPAANQPGVTLRFKGTWVAAQKVKGYTRLTSGDCDSGKIKWVMKSPPPA